MKVFLLVLGIYAALGLTISVRLYIVAINLLKRISPSIDDVLTLKIKLGFVRSALLDGLGWGYYIIRYGAKNFYDELKKF